MTLEEFLDRIDEIMCGTSNAERAYLPHIPKNGSTFLFYWHKDKIMMKTAGRMTLILESPKKGGDQ